jgi:lysophospholipase L1-like esterase
MVSLMVAALALVAGPTPGAAMGTDRTGAALPPDRPTRVLVLGDSVMKGADAVYASKLPGREVVVNTEVSRSTGASAEVLSSLGADWDVVAVLLGHNDGGSPGAYQPAVRRILDQLRDVPRVAWLTIHEVRPYYPGVNQYVAGLQDEYPNLRIADWNAIAAANPGALAGDGLHLNGQGANLMADLVAQQVIETEDERADALDRLAQATTTTAPPTTTTTTPTTTTTEPTTTTEAVTTTTEDRSTEPSSGAGDAIVAEVDGDGSDDGLPINALLAGAAVVVLAALTIGWALARRRQLAARAAAPHQGTDTGTDTKPDATEPDPVSDPGADPGADSQPGPGPGPGA